MAHRRSVPWIPLMLTVVFPLSVIALVMTDGNIAVGLAPIALCGLLYGMWRLPIRISALGVLFLALATECENDASGKWRSPLYQLGILIHANLNSTIPIGALRFTGIDVMCAMVLALGTYRRIASSRIDPPTIPSAPPMDRWMLISLGAVFVWLGWGLAQGGDFRNSLWQMHQLALIPASYFIFRSALNRPEEWKLAGKVLIAAAMVKAALAIWVRHTIFPNDEESLPTTTSHADSILFAFAICILLAMLLESPSKKRLFQAAGPLFFLLWGTAANTRRLAWVEIGIVAISFFFLTRWSWLKKRIAQTVIISLPIVGLYSAAGWKSKSALFAPVGLLRSIVDSDSNSSTASRDMENTNLIWTFKQHPFFGSGYGHEYIMKFPGDDLTRIFPQFKFIPHNSILGLWAFVGGVGFSFIYAMFVVGMFLAMRSYRYATDPLDRTASLCGIAAVVIYGAQCYGDMGITSWTSVFTVGPALAVVGKLAVRTGAWPSRLHEDPVKA